MPDTIHDEFQERDGMLQVARIFNRPEGNEGVRRCLEDSVPRPLGHLTFIEDDRMKVPLGESEIEVDVKTTGVK
ncbi:hypothetical protein COH20_012668 [Aspergillus flavus]|nr:hypothetical protein COH21_012574 [Aspergillus flavus]RAQ69107.1 hypothetical protein COH20_012668 [Aspergillus flavus]